MTVKLMLSEVLAVNWIGLPACQGLCELLSIICRKKRLDKIPLYRRNYLYSCHAA